MHAPLPFGLAMIARRLAPLALVALLAASCGDNDKKSATPATTAPPTTTATTSTVSTGPSGTTPIPAQPSSKGNRLLLGKRDLYPLLAGNLSRYVPDQVRGKSVSIVQVAGIDSFWAGRNAKQRILVKLNLKGSRPPRLADGPAGGLRRPPGAGPGEGHEQTRRQGEDRTGRCSRTRASTSSSAPAT